MGLAPQLSIERGRYYSMSMMKSDVITMSMMKMEDSNNIFDSAVTVGIGGPSSSKATKTKKGDDYSNTPTRRPKAAKAKEGVDAAIKDDNKESKTGKGGKGLSIAAASSSVTYANSGKNPEALPSQLSSPSILPYFGGTDGETCRQSTVNAWKATNTPFHDELDAVISTTLYQTAKSYCQSQIDLYNIASGVVCLLEEQNSNSNYNLSYGEFWMNGNIYFDGDYDLASMFSQTANFTNVGDASSCLADCYTGGPGCIDLAPWLVNYGQVSVEQYCSLQWGQIDTMYNEIKLCAAKAIGNPSNMTQLEYVNEFRYQLATQQECSYKSCFPELDNAIVATSCPSITTNPPTNEPTPVIDPPREIPTINNGVYGHGAVTDLTSIIILLVGTWLVF